MTKITSAALILTVALAALILYLTLAPVTVPKGLPQSDKLNHVLAFAALAFPVALVRPSWLPIAIPAFAAFGGMIEIIQPYFGRGRELLDWLADIAGIGLGSLTGLAFWAACKKLHRGK